MNSIVSEEQPKDNSQIELADIVGVVVKETGERFVEQVTLKSHNGKCVSNDAKDNENKEPYNGRTG